LNKVVILLNFTTKTQRAQQNPIPHITWGK